MGSGPTPNLISSTTTFLVSALSLLLDSSETQGDFVAVNYRVSLPMIDASICFARSAPLLCIGRKVQNTGPRIQGLSHQEATQQQLIHLASARVHVRKHHMARHATIV